MDKISFYVVKLLSDKSVYYPETVILKDVEIRPPQSDFKQELKLLEESIKNFNKHINLDFHCRIGTIVKASSEEEAEILADSKFVKVLDILSLNFPISNLSILNIGYIKKLDTGDIKPILDKTPIEGAQAFVLKDYIYFSYQKIEQWLIKQTNELAIRLQRSLYWSRKAEWEKEIQNKILFNWFSIEALFKQREDDNICPIIKWFLGFPTREKAILISKDILSKLNSSSLYKKWKKKIYKIIEEIRKFRNDSVHNGFRNIDKDINELYLYNHVLSLARSRCQKAVLKALLSGVFSLDEFKEYMPVIFEEMEDLVNDIIHTVLFSLEHRRYSYIKTSYYY